MTALPLEKELLLNIHDTMVKARVLEDRLIKIYKAGEAYFWIGGMGEEAFGVPLGMLVNKGQGLDHDWLHLHYRGSTTMVGMGLPIVDAIRLIMNRASDISTGGRNFANHYAYPKWNVAPVSSVLEVQYQFAIGTAMGQKRQKAKGITVVTGGDAGTAEGDFASCLVWASRPGNELPLLITVQNNGWGISTAYDTQHGEDKIVDRGKAFNIKTFVVDGNDPVESYIKLKEAMAYIRKEKKPVLMEAMVSRLYGHSSADGANRRDVEDPLERFETQLKKWKIITDKKIKSIHDKYTKEAKDAADSVRKEPKPDPNSIWDHVYANNENADWRKF